jgi:hypothetical protein
VRRLENDVPQIVADGQFAAPGSGPKICLSNGHAIKHALVTAFVIAGTFAATAIKAELTATATQSCERLTSLRLPNTTIPLAQAVAPGAVGVHESSGMRPAERIKPVESSSGVPQSGGMAGSKPSPDSAVEGGRG